MNGWLERRWRRISRQTVGSSEYWLLAVDHLSARHALEPWIAEHVAGPTLDLGAGRLAWRSMLAPRAAPYLAADRALASPELDLLFDVQRPFPIASDSVRTVFCCSVLEHVPRPWGVLAEIARILAPGGIAIVSVPFLYYLHGAPDDYYRFTPHGLSRLAADAGLEAVEIAPAGGLAHTALQALSLVTTCLVWSRRFPHPARWTSRLLWWLSRALDRLDKSGRFAQTTNAILRKPSAAPGRSESDRARQAGGDHQQAREESQDDHRLLGSAGGG